MAETAWDRTAQYLRAASDEMLALCEADKLEPQERLYRLKARLGVIPADAAERLARCEEALRWYGSRANWCTSLDVRGVRDRLLGIEYGDGGQRAREALGEK